MEARSEGVNGVPFFNIQVEGEDQKIASFSGAQPPETFKTIFQRLLTRLKSRVQNETFPIITWLQFLLMNQQ